MFKFNFSKKGMVLLVVLATLLVLISLAVAVLSLILSHNRLTVHQVNRVKAYYAALAGMNLAMEEMRNGNWLPATATTYCLCSSTTCPSSPSGLCAGVSITSNAVGVVDDSIPYPVSITVYADATSIAGSGVVPGRKITVQVPYTSSYTY